MRKVFLATIFLFVFIVNFPLGIKERVIASVEPSYNICFCLDNTEFNYSYQELGFEDKYNLSAKQMVAKIMSFGIDKNTAINFTFKNLESVLNSLNNYSYKAPQDSILDVTSGSPVITEEISGQTLNINKIYDDLYNAIMQDNQTSIVGEMIVLPAQVLKEQNTELVHEKSYFRSYITGANQEGRINNIKTALSKLNGVCLMPGERLSFNNIIGETTPENGYMLAKVITNGKYTDDYGGGVCQAATTLYNAALEAGLTIKAVRPHSLKVGYVKGSFDAMVAGKYSDLVIENNFSYPVFIHAYGTSEECGVKIFGKENEFNIKTRSEKIDFNEEEFPNVQHKTKGFLDYYNMSGELVETKQIRSDSYYKLKIDEELN